MLLWGVYVFLHLLTLKVHPYAYFVPFSLLFHSKSTAIKFVKIKQQQNKNTFNSIVSA